MADTFKQNSFSLFTPQEAEREIPLILSIPHSGRLYPQDMTDLSLLPDQVLRSSEDAFVDELLSACFSLPLTILRANIARAYVDLNRHPSEIDSLLFDGPTEIACKRTAAVQAGLGVIPRTVGGGQAIYPNRIAASEAQKRLDTIYYPYHISLQQQIDRLYKQFGCVYLLDMHSMPSIPDRKPKKGGKNRRPKLADIVLGDRWGTSCDAYLTSFVEESLNQSGLITGRNTPYAGGFITRHYGQPMMNIHVLQIEICRDLYIVEDTLKKHDGFQPLHNQLTELLQNLTRHLQHRHLTEREQQTEPAPQQAAE